MVKEIEGVRFFAPEVIFGSKKLVDINTGDFFPFATEEERNNTKELLTATYKNIEVCNDGE
jgi:hypothetical protein